LITSGTFVLLVNLKFVEVPYGGVNVVFGCGNCTSKKKNDI
jgi:hypothetical protein